MLRKLARLIFPKFIYENFSKFYRKFNPVSAPVTDYKIFNSNVEILQKLNINTDLVESIINNNNIIIKGKNFKYKDCMLSWHYHLFAGIVDIFNHKGIEINKILEIGTWDGTFTNFLANIYKDVQIYTVDLPEDSPDNYLARMTENERELFFDTRRRNLKKSNINVYKMNSSKILNKFPDTKFDIIWIDGDHFNPQVTIDIINSIQLAHKETIICVDDVCKENFNTQNSSNESYLTLKNLENNGIIENVFINKRTSSNQEKPKFISLSKII